MSQIKNDRWDSVQAFIAACTAASKIKETIGGMCLTIEEMNTFQDLLKQQGFSIQPVKKNSKVNTEVFFKHFKEELLVQCDRLLRDKGISSAELNECLSLAIDDVNYKFEEYIEEIKSIEEKIKLECKRIKYQRNKYEQELIQARRKISELNSIIEHPNNNDLINFLNWVIKGKYVFDLKKEKFIAAWNNYQEFTFKELYKEFKKFYIS